MHPRTWPAALMLAVVSASPTFAAPAFMAGQWEHHTTLVKADIPGIPEWLIRLAAGRGNRKSCHTQAQLNSHPEDLLKGDDSAVCTLRKLSIDNGRIVFDTFCTNRHFPEGLLVSSRGSYTPTAYGISTTSTGTKNGRPVLILTTATGNLVAGTCTNR